MRARRRRQAEAAAPVPWRPLVAGAVASGVLLPLALPPADHGYLGWLALAPLLAAVRGRGPIAGALSALGAMGLAAALIHSGLLNGRPNLVQPHSAEWIYTGISFMAFPVTLRRSRREQAVVLPQR